MFHVSVCQKRVLRNMMGGFTKSSTLNKALCLLLLFAVGSIQVFLFWNNIQKIFKSRVRKDTEDIGKWLEHLSSMFKTLSSVLRTGKENFKRTTNTFYLLPSPHLLFVSKDRNTY